VEIFLTQGDSVDDEITPPQGAEIRRQRTGPLVVIDEIHRFESDWSELKQRLDLTKGRYILIGKQESNPTLLRGMLADRATVFSVDVTDLDVGRGDYKRILDGISEASYLSSPTYNHILEILEAGPAGRLTPRLLVSHIQGRTDDLARITPTDVDGWASAPSIALAGSAQPRFQNQATLFGVSNQGASQP
jgi:hypothetical protein